MPDQDMTTGVDRRTMMVTGLAAAAGLTAIPFVPETPAAVLSRGTEGLRARADRKGLLCGTAISYEIMRDPDIQAAVLADCNIIVPENELKWSRIQPTQKGPFTYRPAEALYDFAHDRNVAVRGTALHWWNAQPKWAQAYIPSLTAAQAGDFLQNYVRKVVNDWKGRLVHWDVVNEEVDGRGNLIDKLFAPKLGEECIDLCFDVVRDTDPDTLRVYNTNYVEQMANYDQQMRVQVLKQLERLKKRNIPVQALGIQGHLNLVSGFSQTEFRRFLDEVTAMDIKLLVTEFDVSDKGSMKPVSARDVATASLGQDFLDVILSYPEALGLLTWGLTDKGHWTRKDPGRFRKDGIPTRAAPLDDGFQRKPLWHAIANAIDAAPARPKASTLLRMPAKGEIGG